MDNCRKHILFLFTIFILSLKLGSGQIFSYPHEVKQYDFINYDKNRFLFFNDSSSFNNVFASFDKLVFQGEGALNIIHIGGSHIQAGHWTLRMRERFQGFYPGLNGGYGFVFPYVMAATNNPANYNVVYTGLWEGCRNVEKKKQCVLGLSGISVTTYDSLSSITIYPEGCNYFKYKFNRIKIFHTNDSTCFKLDLFCPDIKKTVIINDSLGYTEFILDKYIDTLHLTITKTDTIQQHFVLHGIYLGNDDSGVIYSGIGVNGASVLSFLRCSLLPQHLKAVKPDLIIISLGINDAYGKKFDPDYFEHNYDTLICRIKQAVPNAAILLTTNNDSYYYKKYVNKNGEKVRTVMFGLAERYKIGVWDFYTVMGGLNSIRRWEERGLAKKDKVHLTKEGYILAADLLFSAFVKSYDDYIKHKTVGDKSITN